MYSKYLDGLFCLPCALFGIESGKDKLFRSPLTFWTTAVTRFQNHSSGKCETHNFAVVAMANFKDMMSRRTVAIDQQLNQIVQRQIQENRQKIKSIIKTVVLCGQNAIPLRGERDDNPDDETLNNTLKMPLEMPHIVQRPSRTKLLRLLVVSSFLKSQMKLKRASCFRWWQMRLLIFPTKSSFP